MPVTEISVETSLYGFVSGKNLPLETRMEMYQMVADPLKAKAETPNPLPTRIFLG